MKPTNAASAALFLALGALASGCSDSDDQSPAPLRILVTNDDGVGAPGIDVVVQAITADPQNEVVVSAPAEQRSGSGDDRIGINPQCGSGEVTMAATASGYDEDVWAIDGCPADAVLYALDNLYPDDPPHVILSGINAGQNVGAVEGSGALSSLSGTVGAAKTGACRGVPSVASSQGDPESEDDADYDYQAGLAALLTWLEANRADLLDGQIGTDAITSINIPTCDAGGEIRGTAEVVLGAALPDGVSSLLAPQDCESTFEDPQDDLEAFFNGFVSVTPVPSNAGGTCDNLDI